MRLSCAGVPIGHGQREELVQEELGELDDKLPMIIINWSNFEVSARNHALAKEE